MSISSALSVSLSGLQINQRELDIVAGNIANADTPGHSRKTLATQNRADIDGSSIGVREITVQRAYDRYLSQQYRQSLSESGYHDTIATAEQRLDIMFGRPGDLNALDTIYNEFTSGLEALTTTPEDYTVRSKVISDAGTLAARLNGLSSEIQDMRAEAEQAIADRVNHVNDLLTDIHDLNTQIVAFSSTGRSPAALLDERDQAVNQLSQMMDITVSEGSRNDIRIHTRGGAMLYDSQPATLSFDAAGAIGPEAVWSSDPAERGVGTISLTSYSGYSVDLIAQGAFRSGEIAANLELRDSILTEAQAQIDEFAHALSLALSNRTEEGVAVAGGPPDGFDVDLTGLQQGNAITFDYVDVGTGEDRRVTFLRVDDPALLPLDDSATADPNDEVHGIDFSGGLGAAIADITAALGAGFTVSDQGGNVLRILDDGGATTTASALSASITNSALTDEGAALPFFVDGGAGSAAYTASLEATSQKTGFAGRIAVNQALVTDSTRLVVYETSPETPAGDTTRPRFMIESLNSTTRFFSAETGLGSAASPYSGTVSGMLRQVVNDRGAAMEASARASEAQSIVVNSLSERLESVTKVDVDEELGRLIELQSAYAANARVLQVAQEMLDALLRT